MGREAEFYVKPPRADWHEILKGWNSYITSPVKWGLFVAYVGRIEDLLFYEYPGSNQFNSRYQDKLTLFNEAELAELHHALEKLIRARESQSLATLTKGQQVLFRRLQEVAGEAKIGYVSGSWPIESFKV